MSFPPIKNPEMESIVAAKSPYKVGDTVRYRDHTEFGEMRTSAVVKVVGWSDTDGFSYELRDKNGETRYMDQRWLIENEGTEL